MGQPAAALAIELLLKLMLLALELNWICNCWYCNWCGRNAKLLEKCFK
jgi:hypothetical protein